MHPGVLSLCFICNDLRLKAHHIECSQSEIVANESVKPIERMPVHRFTPEGSRLADIIGTLCPNHGEPRNREREIHANTRGGSRMR